MFKNIFKISLLLTLILTAGLTLAQWTPPPAGLGPPPDCPSTEPACNPPINTSVSIQTKTGGLEVGTLFSRGNIFLRNMGYGLVSDTLDGADNKYVSLSGGGLINDHTRGASMTLWGNEFSFLGLNGSMLLKTGSIGDIIFQTGIVPTERMRILDTGEVGIGVWPPASKLDVNGNICWVPPGGTRKCLGSGVGSGYWAVNAAGDIRNTNTDAGGLPAQVNIKGQIKIEGGSPGLDKILVSNANGLSSWKDPSTLPAVSGIGNDVLNTTFSGCVPLLGCTNRDGDVGPTQSHSLLDGVGTVTMTCPSGYKAVSGGADCDKSWNAIVAVRLSVLNASRPVGENSWLVQCTKLTGTWGSLVATENASAIKSASITCAK